MMRDISPDEILNSLLSDWHHWMTGAQLNGTDRLDDPAFRNARANHSWDSSDEVIEKALHSDTMKSVDFHISGDSRGQGGLAEPYRAAIYCLARNCHSGVYVWSSPRLPKDPMERGVIVLEARNQLMRRLMAAGVM